MVDYTNALMITQPEVGGDINIWGGTINNDMDLVEQAIVGRTAFALSGSKTLVRDPGVIDEARSRILDVTGGTGGTVIIPSVPGFYIVRNKASGVVLFSVDGTTGANISANVVTFIVTDGANVWAPNLDGYVQQVEALIAAGIVDMNEILAEAQAQVGLAADQVTLAADQVALAADQVGLAADQVTLAAGQVTIAQGWANSAQTFSISANAYADEAEGWAIAAAKSAKDAALFDPSSYYTKTATDALFNAIDGGAPAGLNTFDEVAAAIGDDPNFSVTTAAAIAAVAASAFNSSPAYFGDGTDGNVTINGSVSLSRDMHYNNLTITTGAALTTNGYTIFVKGTLDLTNAPAGAIRADAAAAPAASGATGGTAGTLPTAVHVTATGGTAGGNAGGTGSGGVSASTPTGTATLGGAGGKGGDGGASNTPAIGGSGGAQPSVSTPLARSVITDPSPALMTGNASLTAMPINVGGAGGGGGGGGGIGAGGAGGGGGGGGGFIQIFAAIVTRGASTAVGCIRAIGGTGGAAWTTTNSGSGGGGGGGGGPGGWIRLIIGKLTGSTAANAIDLTGGNGGVGGGAGTGGTGGRGGDSGQSGRLELVNFQAGTLTVQAPVASVAGGANSGATGGTGGVATTTRYSL